MCPQLLYIGHWAKCSISPFTYITKISNSFAHTISRTSSLVYQSLYNMGRQRKVVLARISNENKRKASMRKRTKGLLKKVREITTLCGAEAAVVIYNPDDNQPTVWPSTSAARAKISEFLSRPEAERRANSHTAKSFMEDRCRKKEKKQQQIKIKKERNGQALVTLIYEGKTRIQDLDPETKKKLSDFTDQKIEEIRKHIQRLKEQQAPHSHQVLPPVVEMQPVSQATSGLNMNGLSAGRNFQSPAAAHDQLMDVGGMGRLAPALTLPLPTPNLFVMSPNITTVYRLDMTRTFHGQRNFDGLMQREAFTQAQQMPSVSQVAGGLQALNINGLSGGGNFPFPATAAHDQDMNLLHPSLPLDSSHPHSPSSTFNMTRGLYEQTTIGGMIQHSLPSPLQSVTGNLDMSENGLNNAGTTITGEGNFGEMMQYAPPLHILPELPLRQPPMPPPIQYDASGSNMSSAEYSRSTIGSLTPETTALDQSNFGDD